MPRILYSADYELYLGENFLPDSEVLIEPTAALKKLFEWGKSHFNEELVHHFIRAVGIYPVGSLVRLQSGLLGVVVEPDEEDLLHPTVRVIYDMVRGRQQSAGMPPLVTAGPAAD